MIVVICDDDKAFLDTLKGQIEDWAEKYQPKGSIMIKQFQSSEDLLEMFQNGMSIDCLMIDVRIQGEISGLEVAERIFHQDESIPIVFVSNYAEYAMEGYHVNAIRYLKKPITQEDVNECMRLSLSRIASRKDQTLSLITPSQSIHVPIRSVIYAEAVSHALKIITNGKYEIRASLELLESRLPDSGFVRCHRSYLINLQYMRKYRSGKVTLVTGDEIPVGRKYLPQFTEKFRQYYVEA